MVPFDDKSPFVTSGIRVGTPAITSRNMRPNDMETVVSLIDEALMNNSDDIHLGRIKSKVEELMKGFPLYA
jgi:glycine hydroxymethyltransferase